MIFSRKSILLIVTVLLVASHCELLYPSLFKNQKDSQIHQQYSDTPLNIATSCNQTIKYPNFNVPQPFVMMSGYLSVNITNSNSALAFIFTGALAAGNDVSKLSQYPVMFWMNGGPGSSSQLGNLLQMGPIMYDEKNDSLFWNPHTWAQQVNIIYLDQPIGVGFGYLQNPSDLPTNMTGVANQVWTALQNLYLNPNGCFYGLNLQNAPLFIAGESYAGKYVPAITKKIHEMQLETNNPLKLNLRGALIVDGFTDPKAIFSQMGMFSYNLGLVDMQERAILEGYILQAARLIDIGDEDSMKNAQMMFNDGLQHIKAASGYVNVYNFRQVNVTTPYPLEAYLNKVKADLGFNPLKNYTQSNGYIYDQFAQDFMARDCVSQVEYLLQNNLPVLICNGQLDLIVDTPGTMMWVDQLRYQDSNTFSNLDFSLWKINGSTVGYTQSSGPLTYYNVNKAGHMVPGDQPYNSYQMMINWVNANQK